MSISSVSVYPTEAIYPTVSQQSTPYTFNNTEYYDLVSFGHTLEDKSTEGQEPQLQTQQQGLFDKLLFLTNSIAAVNILLWAVRYSTNFL